MKKKSPSITPPGRRENHDQAPIPHAPLRLLSGLLPSEVGVPLIHSYSGTDLRSGTGRSEDNSLVEGSNHL